MNIVIDGVVLTLNKSSFKNPETQFRLQTTFIAGVHHKRYFLEIGIANNTQVDKISLMCNHPSLTLVRKTGLSPIAVITNNQYNEILTIIEDYMDMSIDDLTDGKMGFLEEQDDEESFEDEETV